MCEYSELLVLSTLSSNELHDLFPTQTSLTKAGCRKGLQIETEMFRRQSDDITI